MSTNEINIEAVNARAREEETPMTNIPSVEEVVDNFGKQFDALKMKPSKKSMPGLERESLKDFMRKALTADRLALLTELRDSGLLEEVIPVGDEIVDNPEKERVNREIAGHNTLARNIKEFMSNMDKV